MKTPLCELAELHGSDKSGHHNYTVEYFRRFNDRRDDIKKVLEVGIGDAACMWVVTTAGRPYKVGASLYMWRDFFPNADIYAMDIVPGILINEDRIKSAWADQYKSETLISAAEGFGSKFDLIVDDGCHEPMAQLNAMHALLPHLSEKGVYVIEDLCPYKLPNGDLSAVTNQIPPGYFYESYIGGKGGEALVFIWKR